MAGLSKGRAIFNFWIGSGVGGGVGEGCWVIWYRHDDFFSQTLSCTRNFFLKACMYLKFFLNVTGMSRKCIFEHYEKKISLTLLAQTTNTCIILQYHGLTHAGFLFSTHLTCVLYFFASGSVQEIFFDTNMSNGFFFKITPPPPSEVKRSAAKYKLE